MASIVEVMVAVAPEMLAVPMIEEPSVKTTLPVGLIPCTPVITALNVTGNPNLAGFGADVMITDEAAGVVASVTGGDWLAWRRVSPE
jgi:hypothetical protein